MLLPPPVEEPTYTSIVGAWEGSDSAFTYEISVTSVTEFSVKIYYESGVEIVDEAVTGTYIITGTTISSVIVLGTFASSTWITTDFITLNITLYGGDTITFARQ